ncbi:hypothetical protein DAEQUDRAFT_731898 [Daedalea quercina L-15889]|uniref:Rad9-domain-containing protein n=1 Tax=Daedalea quercina L-15889 TaxID=1314783 RepID=A0A165LZD1_9APHY|nr:hypothetical protein DAEQUDRAFT_731898 [Daedalea quercina L-15889]
MQTTLDANALKQITRALACLSRYGDELTIYATPETLALSTTNQSQSAFCRFKYRRQFFSRYTLTRPAELAEFDAGLSDVAPATGQLQTKNLLSILKHKTVEKTVDKCELIITDGDAPAQGDEDERDSLESRLTVRLHCKHGVVKTHRLLLQTPNSLLAPAIPDVEYHSRLMIGARAVRDMIEHFPLQKGPKSDPQLIWTFNDYDVQVKGMETVMTSKSGPQLATELTISADEFDRYEVFDTPLTLSFHLREFNATIAFAEASSLPLEISFTDPTAPIFIDLTGDLTQSLSVISTSGLGAHAGPARAQSRAPKRKRVLNEREESADAERGARGESVASDMRSMKVVQAVDRASVARELDGDLDAGPRATPLIRESMPPPPMPPPSMRPPSMPLPTLPPPLSLRPPPSRPATARLSSASAARAREPLFLPSSQPAEEQELHMPVAGPLFLPGTQLSQEAEQAIRASGLGIERMTAREFAAMLDGDGEEVGFGADVDMDAHEAREASLEIYEEGNGDGDGEGDIEMEPTQPGGRAKAFRPLFED